MATRITGVLVALVLMAADAFSATSVVHDIPVGGGTTIRILWSRPDNPVATIIAIPGGDGVLGIQPDGTMPTVTGECGPFIRNRAAYAGRGYSLVAIDATADGRVRSPDDIRAVIAFVRARDIVPIWLTGGSASTSVTATVAATLPASDPVGAIFFSPNAFSASVVNSIRRPSQVVYHTGDIGQVGPQLAAALINAPVRETAVLTGGSNSGSCGGFHLFTGLDATFVNTTADFINRLNGTLATSPFNVQALWWGGDSQSGWGVNIAHQGDVLFATWYTYDLDGSALWLYSDARRTTGNEYAGQLHQSRGSPIFTYDRAQFGSSPVGTATFSFATGDSGTFTYTVNGVTQSKPFSRYVFASPTPRCSQSASATPGPPNYEDLWWGGESQSGWGVNIAHQGNVLFATWYTYDVDGSPLWLFSDAHLTSGSTYTGQLHQARSSSLFSYDPTRFVPTPVGTATFTFSGTNSGTFRYTINGTTQEKSISRYVFALPVTTCAFQ